MRLWRNWYPRGIQDAVGEIPWRFKSSQPHQKLDKYADVP